MRSDRDVSVIGLGAMGQALAEAFLNAGHPTTVWNRSANKAAALVAQGAVRAETVADALSSSPLAVVCVLNYEAVREILDPVGAALSGRTLVNLTNGTPEEARETAKWATEHGARYLDGGIMAVPPMIGQAESVLLYSGSQDAFEAHQRELGRLGTSKYLGADAGLASLHDLALLSAMCGMFAGFFHSVALVGREQIKATEFTSALLLPWLNAISMMLPILAYRIDARDYTTDVVSNLGMQAVGFANIARASKDLGIGVELLAPLQALVDRRVADGHGAEDLASLIELVAKPSM